MTTLHLYQRATQEAGYLLDLTPVVTGWRDTARAVGGYLTAEGTITNGISLNEFFNTKLGCVVKRIEHGLTAWEGFVYELRYITGGLEYTRTLNPEKFHNRVKVLYNYLDGPKYADWVEDTGSSGAYGRCEYLPTLGTTTPAQATALRDRHLKQYGWPRSWMSGGLALGERIPQDDVLTVACAGFWATLNWRYQTDTLEQAAATQVTTLLAKSEFVTASRIETNTLTTRLDCTSPQRMGDLLEQVAEAGDASGNIWQIGVYNDRQLIYEQAPMTARYIWRDGLLYDAGGATPALPQLLRPGFLLYNANAPSGGLPAGVTDVWNDPRYGYVDQVEFSQDGTVRLSLYGFDGATSLLETQIANYARMLEARERAAAEALAYDEAKRARWWRNRYHEEHDEPLEPGEERAPG